MQPLPGRYTELQPLSSGGFGTVYRSMDTVAQQLVAVKVARSPEALELLQTEAKIMAALGH